MTESEVDKLSRLEANRLILKAIAKYVEDNPDWRFCQILQNMNIVSTNLDSWYVESTETLKMLQNYPVLKGDIFKSDF